MVEVSPADEIERFQKTHGFEICRQIKRDPLIGDTKVVVMTAQLLDAEPRALEAGADGFLFKPFEAGAVHRLLTRLLGARR